MLVVRILLLLFVMLVPAIYENLDGRREHAGLQNCCLYSYTILRQFNKQRHSVKVTKNENVWYATNIEVYEYVTAYRNLVYSSDETKVYNPSSTDVWVKINGNKVFVPAGKTVNI